MPQIFGGIMAKAKNEEVELLIIDHSDLSTEEDSFLETGILPFDLMTGGGIPKGRVTVLFGKEGSGKTTLGLKIFGKVLEADGFGLYIDAEGAYSRKRCKELGVTGKFAYSSTPVVEEIFPLITKFIDKNKGKYKNLVVFWDSLANSCSVKELDSDLAKQEYSQRAISLSKAFRRKFVQLLADTGTILIMTNQLRDDVSGFGGFGPKDYMPGGRAVKHNASLMIEVKVREKILSNKKGKTGRTAGVLSKLRTTKNRFTAPYREVMMPIYFDERGVNEKLTVFHTLLSGGTITKVSGSSNSFKMKIPKTSKASKNNDKTTKKTTEEITFSKEEFVNEVYDKNLKRIVKKLEELIL